MDFQPPGERTDTDLVDNPNTKILLAIMDAMVSPMKREKKLEIIVSNALL
jgi:hypothetical protein